MSTFKRITKHPNKHEFEKATWHDDYFGPHEYGVEFSDGKVYPADMVTRKQVHDFWAEDVREAFIMFLYGKEDLQWTTEMDDDELEFLNLIEEAYVRRWNNDPITGDGATELSIIVE